MQLERRIITLATLLFSTMAAACIEDDPSGPAQSLRPQWTVASLPVEEIDEHPDMLAIAKEVPEFAGYFFDDDGQLVVAMTDVTKQASAEPRVRSRLGIHETRGGRVTAATARFKSRQVQYSFLDLARYRTVLRSFVFSIDGVVSIGVKESINRVQIGVRNPEARTRVLGALANVGVPVEAVHFRDAGLPQRLNRSSTLYRPALTTLTLQDEVGVMGGVRILRNDDGGCSLGFSARRVSNGAPVFVTNTHCTMDDNVFDGTGFRQPTDTIGFEIVDVGTHSCGFFPDPCRNADAALASITVPFQLGQIARTDDSSNCDHCVMSLQIHASAPTLAVTSQRNSPVENERLHKIGSTSGWTLGNVEDTCDDYNSDAGYVIQCSDRVDFSVHDGDSGSPVFAMKANGTAEIVGVVWGWDGGAPFWYNDGLMSNLGRIQMDLGPLTLFDPGPPVASLVGPPIPVRPDYPCFFFGAFTVAFPRTLYSFQDC